MFSAPYSPFLLSVPGHRVDCTRMRPHGFLRLPDSRALGQLSQSTLLAFSTLLFSLTLSKVSLLTTVPISLSFPLSNKSCSLNHPDTAHTVPYAPNFLFEVQFQLFSYFSWTLLAIRATWMLPLQNLPHHGLSPLCISSFLYSHVIIAPRPIAQKGSGYFSKKCPLLYLLLECFNLIVRRTPSQQIYDYNVVHNES